MSILFNDDLEAYNLAADPFGSWLDIGFFKGQITTNTLNRAHGTRIYQMGLSGQLLFQSLAHAGGDTTTYWMGVNTPNFTIGQTTPTGTGSVGVTFGVFQVEQDRTVSLYANSTIGTHNVAVLLGNSHTQVTYQDVWQDYQVQISAGQNIVTIGTVTRTVLTVGGSVWVAGTLVINGAPINTDLDMSGLPIPGGTNVNNWQFTGNGFIDNIWGADTVLSTATFPFDGSNTKARVTSGAIEIIKQSAPAVRVTSGVVETAKRFTPQARVTQGVIEIIKRGNTSQWSVYEA